MLCSLLAVAAADYSRCGDARAQDTCRRVHAMEPTLPIRPQFLPESEQLSPCIARKGGGDPACLPSVHVISGWHMFADESLGFLEHVPGIEVRSSKSCFDDWDDDSGGGRWVESFGGPLRSKSGLMITHCNRLLSWYPAFAGRYTSVWSQSYFPCKERTMKAYPREDYINGRMWSECRPAALRAHDAAMGTNGSGYEATPPMVMSALYGTRVKVISALRNPIDRLETSFWQVCSLGGGWG